MTLAGLSCYATLNIIRFPNLRRDVAGGVVPHLTESDGVTALFGEYIDDWAGKTQQMSRVKKS